MTPQVILKPSRAQPFYARHPWVFAGAVDRVEGTPADGDEVELRSHAGNFIARGLYNSQSKILVRLYCWEPERALDADFFRERIRSAISLRHDILKLPQGPHAAYRVVFSESDFLSGLIVDRFGSYLSVQFNALGLANRRDLIAGILAEELNVSGVYIRTEKGVGKLEGMDLHDGLLWGEAPDGDIVIHENGLQFIVNLTEGQKTGYYLDQRDNRAAAARYATGRRVLDAFSYSGGFGLYCAKAGAASVECLDASVAALQLAERNAVLNGLTNVSFSHGDVFDVLNIKKAEGDKYDLIVLDPPKFARSRKSVPEALRGYRKLHALALQLLEPGGVLVSCCCTGLVTMTDLEDVIVQVCAAAKRDVQILERRGPGADHPVAGSCREGTYLKCIIVRVG
jgi:23S rRNA (cytosine1962-C5)-methyltransferase